MRLLVHNGQLFGNDGEKLIPIEGIEINSMRLMKHGQLGDTATMQLTLAPHNKQIHIQMEDENFYPEVQSRKPTEHDVHLINIPQLLVSSKIEEMIPAGTGYKLPSGKIVYFHNGQWGDSPNKDEWTEVLACNPDTGLPVNVSGEQIDGEFVV